MKRDTTLVLVTYNSAHLLEERLAACAGWPVVLVDNASADGTADWVRSNFPAVHVIANAVNSGYGRAANLGFDQVSTRYALLVNPDARLDSSAIERLEAKADALADGWLFIAPDVGVAPQRRQKADHGLERVAAASGAALFFDVQALRRLGGFDPEIFLFFEETDLCLRAERARLDLYFAPDVEVPHELGTSTHRSLSLEYMRKWHYNWSRLYFERKHRRWGAFVRTAFVNVVVAGIKLAMGGREPRKAALLRARHDAARTFLAGGSAFDSQGAPCAASLGVGIDLSADET